MKFSVIKSFLLGVFFSGTAAVAGPNHEAVHGMLLFGEKATYASHLPMFHHPHDYQLLMELNLVDLPGSNTVKMYEGLNQSGEKMFTLVPKPMDLSKVISGEITSFNATIFDGHFEKNGTPIGLAKVLIKKVLFSKKLDPEGVTAAAEYLVFGGKGEYFGMHLIQGAPSFDAIVKVSQPYKTEWANCNRRYCPDDEVVAPLPDQMLPIYMKGKVPGEPAPEQRLIGIQQGQITNRTSNILSVHYFESGDLSN